MRRTSQKAEILRDIITADRAFMIMITRQPNDFTIRVEIEKRVQNIADAAILKGSLRTCSFLSRIRGNQHLHSRFGAYAL